MAAYKGQAHGGRRANDGTRSRKMSSGSWTRILFPVLSFLAFPSITCITRISRTCQGEASLSASFRPWSRD